MICPPLFRSLTIAEIFSLRQKLASRKREFSDLAKIPVIVSDRNKGGQIIKLAGSAQTQESTPIDN
jgi:hypothetical protein